MFRISITQDAERQMRSLSPREQRILETAILSRLMYQATVPSKAIKVLRPNPFAQFELRAGNLRVLYNVEEDEVVLLLAGRKSGNALIVEGEVFHAHQDDSTERPGVELKEDP